jgi:4-hydroxy-3-methylbut-2-enyl diphosphate reductase
VIDATCPFVQKVHDHVIRYAREGYDIALIGHRGHEEVVGVAGEAPGHVTIVESVEEAEAFHPRDPAHVAVAMQTTLSDAEAEGIHAVLRRRFPALRTSAKGDICYATTNRQKAVKALAARTGTILVLGARNSSNTRRLAEVAKAAGAAAHLVSRMEDLASIDLDGGDTLGLTAGASTPESFIAEVLGRLREQGFDLVTTLETVHEEIRFALPASLRKAGV